MRRIGWVAVAVVALCLLAAAAFATDRRVVREIYFDLDRAEIRADAQPTLHEVADLLRAYPDLKLHLAGHTCDIASDAYNEALAKRRADNALAWLIRHEGISRDRVIEQSFGEAQPEYPNDDPVAKAKNRRVVLTLDIPELQRAPVQPRDLGEPAAIVRTVTTSVVDAGGNFIPDLTANRFTVTEAGLAKEIVNVRYTMERLASSTGLLLDTSRSNCLIDLRDAVREFLGLANPADRFLVAKFNRSVQVISNFDSDRVAIVAQIPTLVRDGNGTHLYDAVAEASAKLAGRGAPRYLIVFSDGVDEAVLGEARGSAKSLDQAVGAASANGVRLLTVELGPTTAAGRQALQELARRTGGKPFVWDQPAGASQFAEIYRLIGTGGLTGRYTIDYRTTAASPANATVTTTAGTIR